jgi:hypothetical protein
VKNLFASPTGSFIGCLDSSGGVAIFKTPLSSSQLVEGTSNHFSTISNLYRKCLEGIFSTSAWTTIPAARRGGTSRGDTVAQFGPEPFSITIAIFPILYLYKFDPSQQGVVTLTSCHRIIPTNPTDGGDGDNLIDTPEDLYESTTNNEWIVLDEEQNHGQENSTETVPW